MTRRRRAPRPAAPEPPAAPSMRIAEARALAADLIGDLTPHAGDPDAVRAVLLRWLDIEDTARLSMACMSAVQIMFADCLTRVPLDAMPPGALNLTAPTKET